MNKIYSLWLPSSGSSGRKGRTAGIWLMLLTLMCVGQSRLSAQTYCTPVYQYASSNCSYGYQLHIYGFSFTAAAGTSLSDPSGACPSSGYTDRRSAVSTPTVQGGASYTATLTVGSSYHQLARVWIDFNDNGTFETSESIGGINGGLGARAMTLTIPPTAQGGIHRMRLAAYYIYNYSTGSNITSYTELIPCNFVGSGYHYGETRDYNVNVGCLTAPASVAICNGSSTTLTATGGTSYSWSPATGLSSTTGASVVANPTSTTTYTITATTASCGTNTATVTVTVNSIPTISAGSGVAITCGSSATMTATGGTTYSWSPATGLSATTGASVTASPSATTTYTVTGTTSGCSSTATKTVTVNPLAVSAGSDVSIVTGASTTLTATGAANYLWSPATGLSSSTGATVVASPSVTTTYTVTGSTSSSVLYSQAFTYGSTSGPSTTQGIAWSTFCSDLLSTYTYTGFNIRGSSNSTGFTCTDPTVAAAVAQALRNGTDYYGTANGHSWQVGNCGNPRSLAVDASPCSCSGTVIVRPNINNQNWGGFGYACDQASQTLTVEFFISGTSCSNTSTVTVTVAPPVSVSASAGTVCNGTSSTLTATGGTSYTWAPATGLSATTGAVVTATPSVTTTYTVTGTTSTGSAAATVTITVNPAPAAIGGTAAVCMGSTTTLTNSVSGGSWSSSSSSVATIDASGVVTPGSTGNATMTYTLPAGCYTTKEVTVNALPASITGTTDICAGNYTTLSSTSTGGAWSSADVSVATVDASTGVVTGQFAGSATISYTLPTGCYTTTSVNNIVNKITGGSGICQGLTVSLSNATNSGTWSTSDASIADVNFSGIVYAHTAGSATITYTAPDGCYRTHAFGVVSEPAPILGDLVLCMGETSTLTNSSTGGTWSGSVYGVVDGPSGTGVITGIAVGTSNVSYSLSSTCRSIVTVTVQAIPNRIMGTEQTCVGTVTSLSTGSTGGAWSSSNTSTATVDGSGNVTGVAAGTVDISYAFSSTGCARVATVTVNPNPVITGASTVCVGSTAAFTPSITAGGLSWSSSNSSVASVSSTGVVYGLAAGNATITYTLGSGCIGTAAVTVSSVASISGPSVICAGTPVAYTNATAGGTWSTSNTAVATVNASTGEVTGVAGGVVSIIYTSGSCFASKFVTVNPQPGTINGYPVACIGLATTLTNASGTWTSSAPSIASVPTISTGRVVGVSAGTAVITFTAASTGCSRTAVVTVQAAPSASTGTTTVCAGLASILSNSTPGGSWSSSHPAVASVDGTGTVTSVAQGTANITYSFGSTCRTVTPFTVRPLPAAISGTATVCMPAATTLGNTTNGGTWSSSNTAVATVGSVLSALNGRVVGVSAGTAEISYTLSATGCSRSTVVTVNAGANAGTITSGTGTYTLRVTTAPTLALTSSGDAGGTWSSNNPSRATVNPSTGVVTAVSSGNVTITYSVTSGCTNYATRYITVLSGREGNSIAETAAAISLYPNPTTGSFTLQTEQPGTLNIFTMDGRELASHEVAAGATQLSMPSEAATGIYMCRFTAADGTSTIVRLVYEN